jgi:DNA relaxase NicK
MLELRGGICSLLDDPDWISLHGWISKFDGRISRFDIAADDKNGLALDVRKIRDDYKENPRSFSSVYKVGKGGRLPKTLWILGEGEGEGATFNIGKRSSALMHCVYQKGIQLADTVEGKAHPRWVRWEVRFQRSNSNTIHPVILLPTSWVPAFIGSCNYVMHKTDEIGARFIHPVVDPVYEPQEVAARAIKAVSEQWGGVLREVARVIGWDRLIRELERPCSNLIFCDLTSYDTDGIFSKLASLRDGGPASGSGALVACESDVLEW